MSFCFLLFPWFDFLNSRRELVSFSFPLPPLTLAGGGSSASVLDHFVNFAHGMVIGILSGIAATAALLDEQF